MRYRPVEGREDYDEGDYFEQPKQRTSAVRAAPRADDPFALDPKLAGMTKTRKPRVYQTGKVGGVGVRVINVQELAKNVITTLIILAVMFLALIVLQKLWFNWQAGKYTYSAYRESIHSPVPPCLMDGSLKGVTVNGMVILCAESGKVPSKEQINQWQGYLMWQACYEYGDGNECAQLND